jgi:hypothetical protein
MPAPRLFRDVTATVGNTPLIELTRLTKGLPARVAVNTRVTIRDSHRRGRA